MRIARFRPKPSEDLSDNISSSYISALYRGRGLAACKLRAKYTPNFEFYHLPNNKPALTVRICHRFAKTLIYVFPLS